MEFGFTCAKVDEVGLATHCENLGYDFCWATDSPLLRSNPWAVLALIAQQTQTLKVGVGVAVPGLREAADTANGIATINRLAPGRTFLGVGTGNTAMRTLGRRPMRIKEYGEYIELLRGLLNGDEVSYRYKGAAHPIQFQNQHLRYVDVDNYIPIHVGGFGPRAQGLAGELGDGLITGIPRGGSIPEALANVRAGASKRAREVQDFHTAALVNLILLEPGETLSSDRVIEECGSMIMANVHYLVDFVRETGAEPPAYVMPIWEEYLEFHRTRDAQRSHQQLHQSHYSYLEPDEVRFITPDMIRNFCLAGHPEEVVEQLEVLQTQGLNAISFIAPDDAKYRVYEDFARRVIAKMKG